MIGSSLRLVAVSLAFLSFVALPTGCGGDGDGTGASAVCPAYANYEMRCSQGGDDGAGDDDQCYDETWTLVRPEVNSKLVSCLNSLSCEEGEDSCVQSAVAAAGVTQESAANDALYQGCRQAANSCSDTLSDDDCVLVLIATDAARSGFEACLMKQTCEELGACIEAL
ncbi:MAG: hypothetical protein R3A78_04425 [Polyangiales bacterium]|nr:hypothetical protein [Myxococcales bacterium]